MTGAHVLAVAGAALVGALGGALTPRVVAALPEPDAEHEVTELDAPPTEPDSAAGKVPYPVLAARPGLALRCAFAAAAAGAVLAWRLGASPALPMWVYLAAVGVMLAYVDWTSRLLPTRLITPSYAVVVALALLGSALTGDWIALGRAAVGWAVAGGLFFALWFFYPKGMGYGDVRLAGVLGIALGWLGWAELLVGVYAGFLLGALGGGGLALLRVVDRKRYPFGPFMLLGALVGVVAGPFVARWYAG